MPIHINLPYFHPELAESFGKTLSLGLPLTEQEKDHYWISPALPLEQDDILSQLKELKGLPMPMLEYMRHFVSRQKQTEARLVEDELASLSSFVAQDANKPDRTWTNILRQAHYILLWCYHQEEIAREINLLSRHCENAAIKLNNMFNENATDKKTDSSRNDDALLPPWRVCVANAIFFIPEDATIHVSGQMSEDLNEILDFIPLPDFDDRKEYDFLYAQAPLWQVLGHSRPDILLAGSAGAKLKNIYGQNRRWLIRRPK